MWYVTIDTAVTIAFTLALELIKWQFGMVKGRNIQNLTCVLECTLCMQESCVCLVRIVQGAATANMDLLTSLTEDSPEEDCEDSLAMVQLLLVSHAHLPHPLPESGIMVLL